MGEIPVFVISLRDSEVRRRNVAAQLSALDVPFQFVDAIDGRSTPIPDIIDGASVVRSAFDTESQLACAASHRLLHRRIADGYSELALILEDDVRFADDFPAVLAAAAQFEFDVFKLEGGPYFRYHTAVHQIGCRAAIVGMLPSLGAAAYLITKTATQRFCALPNLDQPIDIAFADMRLWLRVLEVKPFVVVQDVTAPTLLRSNRYATRAKRNLRKGISYSVQKRLRIIDRHGLWVAVALERQRFMRAKPEPRQLSV